jgi:hypothetical protein
VHEARVSTDRQFHTHSRSKVARTKSITTRTRSELGQIRNSLSYPASIVQSLPFLQITSRKRTYQSLNVRQPIRAPQVATRSSSSLTKSCGSATNCTVLSSIHTRSVHTDSVFVMTLGTLGTLIGPLGSTSSVFLYLYSRPDPTSSSNRGSRQIGRWTFVPFSKSRLQFGILRICKCPDRIYLRHASSTVYQPLRGIYGRTRQCTSLRSHLPLTADAYQHSMLAKSSWTSHLRGHRAEQ